MFIHLIFLLINFSILYMFYKNYVFSVLFVANTKSICPFYEVEHLALIVQIFSSHTKVRTNYKFLIF